MLGTIVARLDPNMVYESTIGLYFLIYSVQFLLLKCRLPSPRSLRYHIW